MEIIYGTTLAQKIKDDLKCTLKPYQGQRPPKLAVLLIGDDPASLSYIKGKAKACEEVGIAFTLCHLKEDVAEEEVLKTIERCNHDDTIDGILVQLPLPKTLNERTILEAVLPSKDMDGLTTYNMGKLFLQEDGYYPCTPMGIMEILKAMKVDLKGADVVVIGRSSLVGMPLARLLTAQDATVTVCHSHSKNLKEITSKADILIVAIGQARYITKEYVKEGAYVIDVGVNRIAGHLCGDVDFEDVKDHVKAITPVPKGVGPMTIASLLTNTVKAYIKKMEKE